MAPDTVVIGEPWLRDKQTAVDKAVSVLGDIAGKDTDLTVVDLTDGTAILAGNTDRVLPFFNKATVKYVSDVRLYSSAVGGSGVRCQAFGDQC